MGFGFRLRGWRQDGVGALMVHLAPLPFLAAHHCMLPVANRHHHERHEAYEVVLIAHEALDAVLMIRAPGTRPKFGLGSGAQQASVRSARARVGSGGGLGPCAPLQRQPALEAVVVPTDLSEDGGGRGGVRLSGLRGRGERQRDGPTARGSSPPTTRTSSRHRTWSQARARTQARVRSRP